LAFLIAMKTKQTKSDRTRSTILDAARAIFAREGYERTTIRDIAAAAAIDPAMVIRYFRSKEELFARIAEFDLRLPDPTGMAPDRIGEAIVTHFLDIWEGEQAVTGLAVTWPAKTSCRPGAADADQHRRPHRCP
jgi:AcrR family transcriptional regulator